MICLREIVESGSIYLEVFSSWSNDSSQVSRHSCAIRIGRCTNNKSINDLSCSVHSVFRQRDLNATNQVVSYLEVNESHITYLFEDSSIFNVLPASKVYEISCY